MPGCGILGWEHICKQNCFFSDFFCSYLLGSWTCLVMRAARVHRTWPASPYWMSRMACHHLDAVIEGDVVCSQIVEALRRIWGLFVRRR